MEIKQWSLGSLGANCYLVWNDETGVIIDPGGDGDYVSEQLLREKINLQAILLTHAHFDHFSPEDLKKVMKEDAVVVCPEGHFFPA